MLGPVSNEDEGAGFGHWACARAFPGDLCVLVPV